MKKSLLRRLAGRLMRFLPVLFFFRRMHSDSTLGRTELETKELRLAQIVPTHSVYGHLKESIEMGQSPAYAAAFAKWFRLEAEQPGQPWLFRRI